MTWNSTKCALMIGIAVLVAIVAGGHTPTVTAQQTEGLQNAAPHAPWSLFPATGQMTCWDPADTNFPIDEIDCAGTGQDGDIQAGAALSYTDTGDGTIIDENTGLEWEKLCDQDPPGETCPAVHDVDSVYTWAAAFDDKIDELNTEPCFAGHCDWRVPNVKELPSIVNYENVNPAVSPEFNHDCEAGDLPCAVTTCSCTASTFYWSSTSFALDPGNAWFVYFSFGSVGGLDKGIVLHVRAVRGGQ